MCALDGNKGDFDNLHWFLEYEWVKKIDLNYMYLYIMCETWNAIKLLTNKYILMLTSNYIHMETSLDLISKRMELLIGS